MAIALGKNPKTVPTPEAKSPKLISNDFHKLARKMRLKYILHNSENTTQKIFKCRSNFTPPITDSVDLEDYLYNTENELREMMTQNTPT